MDELKSQEKFKTIKSLMTEDNEETEQNYRSERSISFSAAGILPKIARFSEVIKQNFTNKEIKIFETLCPKSEYKNNLTCFLCQKELNLITRKNCKFCGNTVCSQELIKERADPLNSKEFHQICRGCENKYLERLVMSEFDKKKNKIETNYKDLEKENNRLIEEIQKKKNELDKIREKIEEINKKRFEKIKTHERSLLTRRNSIKKTEIIINQLSTISVELEAEIPTISRKIKEISNQIDNLRNDEYENESKLEALEEDNKSMEKINHDLNLKISFKNLEHKFSSKLLPKKSFENRSTIAEGEGVFEEDREQNCMVESLSCKASCVLF